MLLVAHAGASEDAESGEVPVGVGDGGEERVEQSLRDVHDGGGSALDGPTVMPIFPLDVVALPMFEIPLHIFEARYRALFNTLLHGNEGLDDTMIDETSPFLGSGRFAVCYAEDGKMATVGTMVELNSFELNEDGSMDVAALGQERVRVTRVIQELPVMLAEVEPLMDEQDVVGDDDEPLEQLAASVTTLFKALLELTSRLYDEPALDPPEELDELDPVELSFWMAGGIERLANIYEAHGEEEEEDEDEGRYDHGFGDELDGPAEEAQMVVSYGDSFDSDSDDDEDGNDEGDGTGDGAVESEEVERQRRQLEQMMRSLDSDSRAVGAEQEDDDVVIRREEAATPTAGEERAAAAAAAAANGGGDDAGEGRSDEGDEPNDAEQELERLEMELRSDSEELERLQMELRSDREELERLQMEQRSDRESESAQGTAFALDYLEFEPAVFEQQTLLEERSVRARLLRERALLQTVASYLSATTAINDAMAPAAAGGGGVTPSDDDGDSDEKDDEFLPFEVARDLVWKAGLKSEEQWREWCRNGHCPATIPSNPRTKYASKGWVSWPDWLGYDSDSPDAAASAPES